ncbi:MAG: hypothetical protein JWO67_4493 [Streptosporangiaceae bacterium]|nr:hypothetical protein [Streptosporangiaceae bacterium]
MSAPNVTEEQMRAAARTAAQLSRTAGASLEELRDVLGALGFYESPLRADLAPPEWSAGTRSPGTGLEPVGTQPEAGLPVPPGTCRSPEEKHLMTPENTGHSANGRKFCKACNLKRRRADRARKRELNQGNPDV